LRVRIEIWIISVTCIIVLIKEAAGSSQNWVNFYQTTQLNIRKNRNILIASVRSLNSK
jgi:hypothetical protein